MQQVLLKFKMLSLTLGYLTSLGTAMQNNHPFCKLLFREIIFFYITTDSLDQFCPQNIPRCALDVLGQTLG